MKTLKLLIASLFVLTQALTSCQKDNSLQQDYNAELKTNDKDNDPEWIADPVSSYPNPFVDVTTIKYKVEKPSKVILVVYSPGFNGITYLVNTFLREGSYEVEFDASGMPAGEYVAHLRIGKLVFKEKMKKVTSTESNPHLIN
jgi:hypothetical protein